MTSPNEVARIKNIQEILPTADHLRQKIAADPDDAECEVRSSLDYSSRDATPSRVEQTNESMNKVQNNRTRYRCHPNSIERRNRKTFRHLIRTATKSFKIVCYRSLSEEEIVRRINVCLEKQYPDRNAHLRKDDRDCKWYVSMKMRRN